jgi:hypothetical protein
MSVHPLLLMRAFVLSMVVLIAAPSARADAVLLDGVAARVDEKIIFVSDVRARAHGGSMRQALDAIIDAAVVANEAKRIHLDVSADEVKRARANVASQNGVTDEQLSAEIRKQGMSDATWEALIREQILEGKLLQVETAKEVRPKNPDEFEAWAVKRRGVMVERLRAAAFIEVRL